RASFAGLAIAQPRGAIVRAVLEGVAFGLRDVLDAVAASGERPSSGRISGGGARGDRWRAIVAAALELPLTRLVIEDGAALGAAMLGGGAASLWGDGREAPAAGCQRRGVAVGRCRRGGRGGCRARRDDRARPGVGGGLWARPRTLPGAVSGPED